METYWWVILAVLVVLALVASVVDGRGRSGARRRGGERGTGRRPGGRTRPPGRGARGGPSGPGRGGVAGPVPEPGEIWWAEVPYEDGPGSKDRPCLVLSVRGGRAVVAKITSKHHEERPGVIALPAGTVDDARGRRSYLETDELREVAVDGFRRRVGRVGPDLWGRVRGLG
ncbi:type II toxin-antitoxin system PemK/MazF family toxin [Streptomyces sp. NBC_00102]|uniref:type II toxin-antitoxin system PemK/MazF family toxin n=1 Tax=Streptomyces sp. NBC_00102 TaxID=2975652 RepID=UPI00224FE39F|nr:type II toxin-antitoxin system PemK/MazF family toxin [Streptomyces sp. NBC_00102]MCX5397303.1 type II toxin-antitoxin system PemK/MazF family toxin [Streptomyces sp. NBC_00102]